MSHRPPSLPWSQSILLFGWWGLYLPLLVFLPIFAVIHMSGPRPSGAEYLLARVVFPGIAAGIFGFIIYRMRRDLAEYRRLCTERAFEEFEDDYPDDDDEEDFEDSDPFGTEYEPDEDDSGEWRK